METNQRPTFSMWGTNPICRGSVHVTSRDRSNLTASNVAVLHGCPFPPPLPETHASVRANQVTYTSGPRPRAIHLLGLIYLSGSSVICRCKPAGYCHHGEAHLKNLSDKGMNNLMKDGTLSDLKFLHLEECEDCLTSKQHRVSFKTKRIPKTDMLELIHSYVYGLMSTQSLNKSRYFVTFIDDHTQKV